MVVFLDLTEEMIKCFNDCSRTGNYHPFMTSNREFLSNLSGNLKKVDFKTNYLCNIISSQSKYCFDYILKWNPQNPEIISGTLNLDRQIPVFVKDLKHALTIKNWGDFYSKYRSTADFMISEALRQGKIEFGIEYNGNIFDSFELRDLIVENDTMGVAPPVTNIWQDTKNLHAMINEEATKKQYNAEMEQSPKNVLKIKLSGLKPSEPSEKIRKQALHITNVVDNSQNVTELNTGGIYSKPEQENQRRLDRELPIEPKEPIKLKRSERVAKLQEQEHRENNVKSFESSPMQSSTGIEPKEVIPDGSEYFDSALSELMKTARPNDLPGSESFDDDQKSFEIRIENLTAEEIQKTFVYSFEAVDNLDFEPRLADNVSFNEQLHNQQIKHEEVDLRVNTKHELEQPAAGTVKERSEKQREIEQPVDDIGMFSVESNQENNSHSTVNESPSNPTDDDDEIEEMNKKFQQELDEQNRVQEQKLQAARQRRAEMNRKAAEDFKAASKHAREKKEDV